MSVSSPASEFQTNPTLPHPLQVTQPRSHFLFSLFFFPHFDLESHLASQVLGRTRRPLIALEMLRGNKKCCLLKSQDE